ADDRDVLQYLKLDREIRPEVAHFEDQRDALQPGYEPRCGSLKNGRRSTHDDIDATDTQGRERGRQHEADVTRCAMDEALMKSTIGIRPHDRDAWLDIRR